MNARYRAFFFFLLSLLLFTLPFNQGFFFIDASVCCLRSIEVKRSSSLSKTKRLTTDVEREGEGWKSQLP